VPGDGGRGGSRPRSIVGAVRSRSPARDRYTRLMSLSLISAESPMSSRRPHVRVAHALAVSSILAVCAAGCSVLRDWTDTDRASPHWERSGTARVSYYGNELRGRRTASGERFNPEGLTAAHRTLRFGTRVEFLNPGNGKTVVVRINDRGPAVRGRQFDLSLGAARVLGITRRGVSSLKYRILVERGEG
jgi:rare lipoprotein A